MCNTLTGISVGGILIAAVMVTVVMQTFLRHDPQLRSREETKAALIKMSDEYENTPLVLSGNDKDLARCLLHTAYPERYESNRRMLGFICDVSFGKAGIIVSKI